MDNAMQLSQALTQNIGLAHQILLTDGPETCDESKRILPELCCVWNSKQLPESHFQHQLLLWNHRRALAARALRLGYNIMVLDTDMVVFDDPYKYLKRPPFNDINLLTMGETWPYETNYLLNLGFLYAQNARVDGPVSAILAEVPDRQLRMANDRENRALTMWKVHQNCATDEQLLFDDVIYGSILKAPVHIVSMDACGVQEARDEPWVNWTAVSRRRETLVGSGMIFTNNIEEAPVEWAEIVGGSTFMLKRANLHWWHESRLARLPINTSVSSTYASNKWPLEYGGQLLPPQRGQLSSAFQSLLLDECKCPLWPDPSSPSSINTVDAPDAPVEKFAIAPHFLVASFQARGIKGLWGQHGGRPQQVLGHIHQTPCDSWIGKRTIGQMLKQYNWSISKRLNGNNIFFASSNLVPSPKVVAFVPCLDIGKFITSLEDYKAILRGLVAVALLTNRAFVIPDLPCSLPFISNKQNRTWALPLDLNHGFMARGSLVSELKCTWQAFMMGGCMAGPVLSLAPWEFVQYKRQLGSNISRHSLNNTVTLMTGTSSSNEACKQNQGRRRRSLQQSVIAGTKAFVWKTRPDLLLSKLEGFYNEQVIYLRRPIIVEWNESKQTLATSPLKQAYDERLRGCFAIKRSSINQPLNLVEKPLS